MFFILFRIKYVPPRDEDRRIKGTGTRFSYRQTHVLKCLWWVKFWSLFFCYVSQRISQQSAVAREIEPVASGLSERISAGSHILRITMLVYRTWPWRWGTMLARNGCIWIQVQIVLLPRKSTSSSTHQWEPLIFWMPLPLNWFPNALVHCTVIATFSGSSSLNENKESKMKQGNI
jgi:hypothetical protein